MVKCRIYIKMNTEEFLDNNVNIPLVLAGIPRCGDVVLLTEIQIIELENEAKLSGDRVTEGYSSYYPEWYRKGHTGIKDTDSLLFNEAKYVKHVVFKAWSDNTYVSGSDEVHVVLGKKN